MSDAVWNARRDAIKEALRRNCDRPLTAIELASFCGMVELRYSVEMKHETKRRRVRELIADLRTDGFRIVAGVRRGNDECGIRNAELGVRSEAELGYWLARDDAEWHAYLESRKAEARFEFVAVREMSVAARERTTGQGSLFGKQGSEATRQQDEAWARV